MQEKRLNKKSPRRNSSVIILILLLFLVFLVWLLFFRNDPNVKDSGTFQGNNDTAVVKSDTAAGATKADTSKVIPPSDTINKKADTLQVRKKKKQTDTISKVPSIPQDTIDTTAKSDSSAIAPDTLDTIEIADPCVQDTVPLWVYPDPSGGLHRKTVRVTFGYNKKCKISWKFKKDSEWRLYDGTPVKIEATSTLDYFAEDSCGKLMETRSEYYEIEQRQQSQFCPQGMEYIKVGTMSFCIDRYEWPNRKSAVPLSYISMYGASDSCYSVGKRLCTAEEWSIACAGPYSWKYPYGQNYEKYACSTHDTMVTRSGEKAECRSFFGVYDMSGGLAEWTDTRASENRNFYYVNGGFWESGPQSGCFDKRYSYFPQNRHNPVGFRCCQDAITGKQSPEK